MRIPRRSGSSMKFPRSTWLSLLVFGLTGFAVGFQTSPFLLKQRTVRSFELSSSFSHGSKRPSQASQGSETPPSNFPASSNSNKRIQQRDVVIVGGGLAGLSAALYLRQMDPSRHVTIFDREQPNERSTVASFAAAGMLAPNSERLPKGPLLDLCMASRRMYSEFVHLVESFAQESGDEGSLYLKDEEKSDTMDPWSVGYVASGGFLAPAFAGDSVATWAPPEGSGTATWLDATQMRELEPHLHPEIVGGWWFPEDASVDARRLTCSLRAACVAAGVQILHGQEVTSLDLTDGQCQGLWLQNGRYIRAKSVLIANGAWMRQLLPVPVEPHKGQSLSLRMPSDQPPILRRVLFAQDSYIVPKADGRIVVGATVEAGSYDSNVTPAGLLHVLTHALQLVPELKDLPIEETWVGLRPTTPDKGPILGRTPWDNLFLAGGYWRNGVLLAPKTGQLLASLLSGQSLSTQDAKLLDAFGWDRFTSAEKSTQLAASARYAASMHPIHSRKSGAGVSAAVGTELGSYSSARAAKEERQRDRQTLWKLDTDDGNEDDAFERAAAMGRQDGSAYSFGDDGSSTTNKWTHLLSKDNKEEQPSSKDTAAQQESSSPFPTSNYMDSLQPYEGSADAFTVGSASALADSSTRTSSDLDETYQAIHANKSRQGVVLDDGDDDNEERPDPGFRIYHVDPSNGEKREIPPYTSPGEFEEMLEKERRGEISLTRPLAQVDENNGQEASGTSDSDLDAAYQAIRANKARQAADLNDDDSDEERPDPGFRIYHVDPNTDEKRVVPPYTSPGEFQAMLDKEASENRPGTSKLEAPLEAVNGSSAMTPPTSNGASEYSEQTYDGYQDIRPGESREQELQAMREARRKNRMGHTPIDPSDI